jgi:hypothetical protein
MYEVQRPHSLTVPTRVHLDIEQGLTDPFDDRAAYALFAMTQEDHLPDGTPVDVDDNRWHTYQVPGHPTDTTLQN